MRQAPNTRRTRGRSNGTNRRANLPNRNQTFDSNGPEVRIRGNAYQVHEKYLTLARDASASGDRIMSENYLQHAEHYYRIINAINEAYREAERQTYEQPRESSAREQGQRDNGGRDGKGGDGGSRESGLFDGNTFDGDPTDTGPRDNGHRDQREAGSGETGRREGKGRDSRDNGQREGAAKGNGQARDHGFRNSDSGQPDIEDPRDSRGLDFGADPRHSDDEPEGDESEQERSLPRQRLVDLTGTPEAGAGAQAAEGGEGGEPQKAPRPRRRVQRPRRTSVNGTTDTAGGSDGDAEG